MIFLIYNLVLLILSPLILLFIVYRIFISRKSVRSWKDQLGLVRLPKQIRSHSPVWIHAVSVGESVASAAVVSEIKSRLPQKAVVISTTTETGQAQARKCIKDADAFIYYPFDLLPSVLQSIKTVSPCVFASTDTEIWPNFRFVLRMMQIRNGLINGTISDQTMHGAARFPWLYRWALGNMDIFCMQSKEDADRIIFIGADPKKVLVTGNIKWDQAVSELTGLNEDALRSRYKIDRGTPVFVAGSTNPGEDAPVLDAFLDIRRTCPDLKIIIAPRQIERMEEIRQLGRDRNLSVGWRSSPETINGSEDLIILDTFGELAKVYVLATISFVGGSLIPRGCHSILQPIALGKPVFYGPHTFKARDVTVQAERAGVGFKIRSATELSHQATVLLSDPVLLEEISQRCKALVSANHGAASRTVDALLAN